LREGQVWLGELLATVVPPADDGADDGAGGRDDLDDVPAARARALTALAYARFTGGEAEEAERLLTGGLGQIGAMHDPWYLAWSRVILAALVLFRGDRAQAKAVLDELHAVATAQDLDNWIAGAAFWRGELARADGDMRAAEAHFARCLDVCHASGNVWGMGYALAALGRIAATQGDAARAAAMHRQALGARRQLDDRRGVAFSVAELGLALAAGSEAADGVTLLGAADALYARLSVAAVLLPDWQDARERAFAAARVHLGQTAFESAYRRGASLSLDEAVEAALGVVTSQGDARQPRSDAIAWPLTDRQREIVSRVADGHTNREISDALSLSVRTVEWHVSNLLIKLSLRSRAQLARWAAEHGYVSAASDVVHAAAVGSPPAHVERR
jgi:non-specific serine/threonine protein kinase